jgi:hypothetical protein
LTADIIISPENAFFFFVTKRCNNAAHAILEIERWMHVMRWLFHPSSEAYREVMKEAKDILSCSNPGGCSAYLAVKIDGAQ